MTSKKRQLIFLWMYVEWGGAQIYLLAIMKVARPDWDILVILPRNSLPDILGYITAIGVRYEFIDACLDTAPAPTLKRKLERHWRRIHAEVVSFRHLRRYNLREAVLHVETLPWQSWQFLTTLSLRGANVFLTLHNALPNSPAWRELVWKARMNFVSRLPGFHIFTSNLATKDKFRRWFTRDFWETIKVTYTCVNPPEIEQALQSPPDAAELRKRFDIDEGKFVVLCVGQFIDRKGRWVFLDAAKIVNQTHRDVSFIWLSPKAPSEDEAELIKAYGLGSNFRLILSETAGNKREEILRFFRIADVFALPSFVEGLPIALLEAMAIGLPSVSTRINAIPEAIDDQETGFLIKPGNAPELARAIIELKTNHALRQKLASNGRQFVLENFDERVASKIAIDAYKECFADGR